MLSPELKNLSYNNFNNYLSKAHSCSTYRKQQFFGTVKSRDQYQIIDPTNCHLRVVCTFGRESAQAQESIKQNKTNAEHISNEFLCYKGRPKILFATAIDWFGLESLRLIRKQGSAKTLGAREERIHFNFVAIK